MDESLLRFVLARTERNTNLIYLDDLSHHNLIISFSQLQHNDPTFLMAGLLHDFFKGLLFFKEGKWNHVSDKKNYEEIILRNCGKVDETRLIELICTHHDRDSKEQNPIRIAEIGGKQNLRGIVGNLESRAFVSEHVYGLKSFTILPRGRYHWLLISALHEELKKYLSELYSKRLKELLNVSSLEFRYVPISFSNTYDELSQYVESLELDKFRLFVRNGRLVIPIPVRNLPEEFAIIYSGAETIEVGNDTLTVPFGEALALFALTGNEITLSYVDPGCNVDLDTLLEDILEKSGKAQQFPYSTGELKNSLEGTYKAQDSCSFCESPASKVITQIVKRDRFTDMSLLLNDQGNACPVCYAGYLVEQGEVPNIRAQDAEIYELEAELPFNWINCSDFAVSASGLMWQQVLSKAWYELFRVEEHPDFILDPWIRIHPVTARFVPRAFFPMAWKMGNKKHCLQSSVNSDLTALGSEGNISVEEFKHLTRAYRINKDRLDKRRMVKQIKKIYGITIGGGKSDKSADSSN